MTLVRASARQHICMRRPALVVIVVVLAVLAAAAPAFGKSGRVGPEAPVAFGAGALAAQLAEATDTSYGIWDAQTTGSLTYASASTSPLMTLTARDASGTPVWTAEGEDVWAASGTLPAALVATFASWDANLLRDGVLTAYRAGGGIRFHRTFTKAFVQPLAMTTQRLVWIETHANSVTRLYVRQDGVIRSLAMPYVPGKAHFLPLAAASRTGGRVLIGIDTPRAINGQLAETFWLRVDRDGAPRIVARDLSQWYYAAMSPSGDKVAVMTTIGMGRTGNRWVSFGKFTGPVFGDPDSGTITVGARSIFMEGGYQYESDAASWGTWTASVYDYFLGTMYKRAWTYDDSSTLIWFRCDQSVRYLAGIVNATGALTVVDDSTWATASVPGTWADAVPLRNSRLALMAPDGTFSIVPNPVASP